MKILIMGAGAVGGCYGGMLAWSGQEVVFVARGEHLEAIRSKGLRVESATMGSFTVHPTAVERPDGSWKADLVLFCVKAYSNQQAVDVIAPAVGGSTVILTLQNGIGSSDLLAERFGREKVLLGAAYIDAVRKGPGVVAGVGNSTRIVFGEESGDKSERAGRILETLRSAGIDAIISSNILKDLWNKLIYICALSGMSCITRPQSFAEVMDTPQTRELTRRVMEEAYAVGKANGVALDEAIMDSTMARFMAAKGDLVSSMYADLKASNPLELSALNGAVSRLGKEAGVPTPVNDFITACLTVADNRARAARM